MLCSQVAIDLTGHNPENLLRGLQTPITKTSTAGELKLKKSYTAEQEKNCFLTTTEVFPLSRRKCGGRERVGHAPNILTL